MLSKSEFVKSLDNLTPPPEISYILKALWFLKKGEWNEAHHLVQNDSSGMGALIHGYLHKIEGDHGNANYWYRTAGESNPDISVEEEWDKLVTRYTSS